MSLPSSQERTTTRPLPPDGDRPTAPTGASRRVFLASTTALALGATAAATIDGLASGGPRTADSASASGLDVTELEAGTLVAYIRPGESEITIMSGDQEVVVDDPALARALARAASRTAGTR